MQPNPTNHRRSTNLLGRLVRWYKAQVIRRRIDELEQQLSTLREHMAIDAVLAQQQRPRFLRDAVLLSRMHSDKAMEQCLASALDALKQTLVELEGQP